MRKHEKDIFDAMVAKTLDHHFEIKRLKRILDIKTANEQKLESTVYLLEKQLGAVIDYLKLDFKVIPAKPMKVIKEVPEVLKAIKKVNKK